MPHIFENSHAWIPENIYTCAAIIYPQQERKGIITKVFFGVLGFSNNLFIRVYFAGKLTSNIMLQLLHLECLELRVTGDRKLALACVIPT